MITDKFRTMALGVCVLGSGALFQEIEPAAKAEQFVFAKGEHELPELIESCASFLKRNYLYSKREVSAGGSVVSIKLQQEIRVDAKGCEVVFNQLLYTNGFAVVMRNPVQGIYEIINMAGPKRNEISSAAQWMTPEKVLENRNNYTVVLTSVSLENINANTATTALRPFFSSANSPSGGLIPGNIGNGRAMLLQGYAPSVAQAIELLRQVDVPPNEAQSSLARRLSSVEARLKKLEASK